MAVLGGVAGLIQVRWINPDVFGEFRKYGILTAYFNIGLVLVHDGLSRQFCYLSGKGDRNSALQTAAVAKWWYLTIAFLFSAIFLWLALNSLWKLDYRAAGGWCTQIPCVWTAIYGAYLGVMYRTSLDFRRLSINNVIVSIIGFFSLGLVKLWGFWGLLIRLLLQNNINLFINRRYVPVRVKAIFDFSKLLALAKISVPLALPGYINTSFLSATMSYAVLHYCGQSALGVYAIATTFQAMAMTFNAALDQIFTTKLTCRFGVTDDIFSCLKYSKIPTLLSIVVAASLAVAFSLMIGPFIRMFIPQYEAAIPVIQVLAINLPISAAGLPLTLLRSALWYKSITFLMIIRCLACLIAVVLLPKTATFVAASLVLGEFCALIAGFGILTWAYHRRIEIEANRL